MWVKKLQFVLKRVPILIKVSLGRQFSTFFWVNSWFWQTPARFAEILHKMVIVRPYTIPYTTIIISQLLAHVFDKKLYLCLHCGTPRFWQLTLPQPEGADYAHPLQWHPRIFRPSYGLVLNYNDNFAILDTVSAHPYFESQSWFFFKRINESS